jgi:spore coat protein A, manganese oxidase
LSDDPESEIVIPQIMLFKVAGKVTAPDTSSLPMHLKPIAKLSPDKAAATRNIVLDQMTMPDGSIMMMLNNKGWRDPIDEKPVLGTTEVWQIVDAMKITHPFHIHLVEFQVLDRRPFDIDEFHKSGKIVFTGEAEKPDANEQGWKDTVRATGRHVTRIIMRFAPFPGFYVYHCHILEHEDMDMMRPFQIVEPMAASFH